MRGALVCFRMPIETAAGRSDGHTHTEPSGSSTLTSPASLWWFAHPLRCRLEVGHIPRAFKRRLSANKIGHGDFELLSSSHPQQCVRLKPDLMQPFWTSV